jgi:hypothetical protein
MIDWLILLMLIGEVIILAILDKISCRTWATPFFLLAIPYTVVVLITYCFSTVLGFISLYVESVLIWAVGLLFFFMGGLIISLPLGKSIRFMAKENLLFLGEKKSQKIALILAWISIIVISCGLINSLKNLGWQQFGTDEFSKSYGYGWVGHFITFSKVITIFLIGTTSNRNIFKMLTILILLSLYIMYPVKSWVILPIIAGFIYRLSTGRFRPSLTKAALLLFLIFVFFNLVYLTKFVVKDIGSIYNIATHKSLMTHFVHYIFAGVLALGNVVKTGFTNIHSNPQAIFAPFLNLYAVFFNGELVSNVTANFSIISDNLKDSNVHTFFGTIYINLGVFFCIIYVMFSGVFVYGLFAIARITGNCWAWIAWVFIGSMLTIGWFEFYFWHLQTIEVPIYCGLLAFVVWLFGWRYHRKWDTLAASSASSYDK